MEPSWLPQTPAILYNSGFVVCEFWKTFNTVKSDTICKYISKKKDVKDEISNPMTLMEIKFEFLFFFEAINWEIEKSNDNQSAKFPKDGIINWIYITTF